MRENIERLERQAKQALEADREDLARLALQRKQNALIELQGLDEQIEGMEQEQQKLTIAEQRLQAKVDAFRNKKEIIKAQYTAAQAQVRIGSALGGISEEMSDVSMAMQRAENKTDQLRAKAGAIDELVETGVLDDIGGPRDDIERELAQLSISQGVEEELAALKGTSGSTRLPCPRARQTSTLSLTPCETGAPASLKGRWQGSMIVRILGEGQFNLPGAAIDELNDIDNRMVEAVEAEDRDALHSLLLEMETLVREKGEPVPLDELVESDLILPETDLTLEEAESIFVGEGLLPG